MILTKVVATMGPACADVETLAQMISAGTDVCRLNFSHGTLDAHLAMLKTIRAASEQAGTPVAILGDLCGPKIRLGKVGDEQGLGGLVVNTGDVLILQRQVIEGKREDKETVRASSIYAHLIDDVAVGHRILIEDGMLRFVVTEKNYNEVRCACTIGGILKSSKGINLPHTKVQIPSITDRDWECANWAIENDLDFLALSFVRRAEDLNHLRQHLINRGSDIGLIAKIEKAEALEVIGEILEASDGLMVARGDLGVEMDVAQVPIIQKSLIRSCQAAGKPVIVATQMLQSMIEQASPTRAEVSDVANAILDGTDAVMLSGETSVGKYPLGAVAVMEHIAEVTEGYMHVQQNPAYPELSLKTMALSSAVSRGVWQIVHDLKAKLVVAWSQNGSTARIFAKNRYPVPIVALSSDPRALRRMKLLYGVHPLALSPPASTMELVEETEKLVLAHKLAAKGDRIVIAAGAALGLASSLNGLVIHVIGEGLPETQVLLPTGVVAAIQPGGDLPPARGFAYTDAPTE